MSNPLRLLEFPDQQYIHIEEDLFQDETSPQNNLQDIDQQFQPDEYKCGDFHNSNMNLQLLHSYELINNDNSNFQQNHFSLQNTSRSRVLTTQFTSFSNSNPLKNNISNNNLQYNNTSFMQQATSQQQEEEQNEQQQQQQQQQQNREDDEN